MPPLRAVTFGNSNINGTTTYLAGSWRAGRGISRRIRRTLSTSTAVRPSVRDGSRSRAAIAWRAMVRRGVASVLHRSPAPRVAASVRLEHRLHRVPDRLRAGPGGAGRSALLRYRRNGAHRPAGPPDAARRVAVRRRGRSSRRSRHHRPDQSVRRLGSDAAQPIRRPSNRESEHAVGRSRHHLRTSDRPRRAHRHAGRSDGLSTRHDVRPQPVGARLTRRRHLSRRRSVCRRRQHLLDLSPSDPGRRTAQQRSRRLGRHPHQRTSRRIHQGERPEHADRLTRVERRLETAHSVQSLVHRSDRRRPRLREFAPGRRSAARRAPRTAWSSGR